MNAQHENTLQLVPDFIIAPKEGETTLHLLQATGCTAGDFDLYNAVERAIECTIASEGPNVGPLGQSVLLAETATQPPISCMIDLVTGSASECNTEIPPDRRTAAYNAFTEVTNFQPADLAVFFSQVTDEQRRILNLNAFYIYFPTFVIILIAIWLMVGFNWISWPVGLFLSVLAFIVLYSFSILYRIQVFGLLSNQNTTWQSNAANVQSNFVNSIAYWPQGLFAVACAVTSTGDTGWTCNSGTTSETLVLSPEKKKANRARLTQPTTCGKDCGNVELEVKEDKPKRRKRASRRGQIQE